MDEPLTCPKCGGHEIDTVVYGFPAWPMRPGTVTGGCVVTPEGPDLICSSCSHEWQTPDSFRARAWAESTGSAWPVDGDSVRPNTSD